MYTYTYILMRTYIQRHRSCVVELITVLVDCRDQFDNTLTCIYTPMYTYSFTHGLREKYVN